MLTSTAENLTTPFFQGLNFNTKYIAVYSNSPLERVKTISDATGYTYFPVIDNDDRRELKGVITRSQILDFRAVEGIRVEDLLRDKKPPIRAYINEPSKQVLNRMLRNNLTRLPVVNTKNQLKGVITLKNLSKI